MEDVIAIVCALIGLPWLFLHYVTQWKRARGLTIEDEQLLDEMHATARRLAERLQTVERIIAADDPSYRPDAARDGAAAPFTDEIAEIRNRYRDRAGR